jgi:hypothetical protein
MKREVRLNRDVIYVANPWLGYHSSSPPKYLSSTEAKEKFGVLTAEICATTVLKTP